MAIFTSILFFALTLLAVSSFSLAQQFMVNTPTGATQCQPLLINWVGGTPPFYPSLIPGGQPSAPPLLLFPQTSANQLTWNVNMPAGTQFSIALKDSNGEVVYSSPVTVIANSDTSCVGKDIASASGAVGSASIPTPSPINAGASVSGTNEVPTSTSMHSTTPQAQSPTSTASRTSQSSAVQSGGAVRSVEIGSEPYGGIVLGLVSLAILVW